MPGSTRNGESRARSHGGHNRPAVDDGGHKSADKKARPINLCGHVRHFADANAVDDVTPTAGADASAMSGGSWNWMDQAAAAVTLGKGVRTIERWVKEARIESRKDPNGKRQVLVFIPEAQADTTAAVSAVG